ncbi:MAG: DUF4388 domain-containing protein [Vicinamibacteria bacterium]|nr:DUF4388 domain-containing protein [Vicinamibacteria bacterium]
MGIRDLPNPEGGIDERDFPDIVHALHENRWTGSLSVTQNDVSKSVLVEEGRLVFASSTSVDDRLGELLVRTARLTTRQFHDAGNLVGPGRRLGAVLVEQGLLTPKELVQAVIEQTQEIIYSLFEWTTGRYRLRDGRESSTEAITLKMSTPAIIMEGIRRISAWSRIDRAVGGLSARYVRADGYEDTIANMGLSLEKLSLLTSLNGNRSVEDICADSTLSDFEVYRCLWAFRVIGVVRRLDEPRPFDAMMEDEGLGMLLAGEEQ